MPPISSLICFQLQPLSRLIPRIFSVNSARVMDDLLLLRRACLFQGRRAIAVPRRGLLLLTLHWWLHPVAADHDAPSFYAAIGQFFSARNKDPFARLDVACRGRSE